MSKRVVPLLLLMFLGIILTMPSVVSSVAETAVVVSIPSTNFYDFLNVSNAAWAVLTNNTASFIVSPDGTVYSVNSPNTQIIVDNGVVYTVVLSNNTLTIHEVKTGAPIVALNASDAAGVSLVYAPGDGTVWVVLGTSSGTYVTYSVNLTDSTTKKFDNSYVCGYGKCVLTTASSVDVFDYNGTYLYSLVADPAFNPVYHIAYPASDAAIDIGVVVTYTGTGGLTTTSAYVFRVSPLGVTPVAPGSPLSNIVFDIKFCPSNLVYRVVELFGNLGVNIQGGVAITKYAPVAPGTSIWYGAAVNVTGFFNGTTYTIFGNGKVLMIPPLKGTFEIDNTLYTLPGTPKTPARPNYQLTFTNTTKATPPTPPVAEVVTSLPPSTTVTLVNSITPTQTPVSDYTVCATLPYAVTYANTTHAVLAPVCDVSIYVLNLTTAQPEPAPQYIQLYNQTANTGDFVIVYMQTTTNTYMLYGTVLYLTTEPSYGLPIITERVPPTTVSYDGKTLTIILPESKLMWAPSGPSVAVKLPSGKTVRAVYVDGAPTDNYVVVNGWLTVDPSSSVTIVFKEGSASLGGEITENAWAPYTLVTVSAITAIIIIMKKLSKRE